MTTASAPFALTDSILFTGEAFVEKQALLVREGHVVDIVPNHMIPDDYPKHSCAGQILAPAFIDCQVNGGGNVLLNNTPTAQGLLAIAAAHHKSGTTRLLPTCITDTPEVIKAAIAAMRAARKTDPSILGIHLEGPHISKDAKGAHDQTLIRGITDGDKQLYRPQQDEIILLTLAPETVPPEDIRDLVSQNNIVSIGHTRALISQLSAAVNAGARNVTHLFNAMMPMTAREPGPSGFALDCDSIFTDIIIDGQHVSAEMVRLAVRAKAADKLFMVSDAAPPSGADIRLPYKMGGLNVSPMPDGRCINETGGLAGSGLTLGQCVPIAIKDMRLDPERVLRMASTIPAQFLGLGNQLGKLLPTYKADIVAMDMSFNTQSVWRDGVRMR